MREVLPATLKRYVLAPEVLEDTEVWLRERGLLGLEAVVLWIGRVIDDELAEVLIAFRPHQVAYVSDDGCAVEVPQESLSSLITSLPAGVFVLARVHSHPTHAYHSPVDDQNMLISHNGAISIVVPDFARGDLDLQQC